MLDIKIKSSPRYHRYLYERRRWGVASVEIVRLDGDAEIGQLGEARRLLGQIAPKSRCVLSNHDVELVPTSGSEQPLITGARRRAAADRLTACRSIK